MTYPDLSIIQLVTITIIAFVAQVGGCIVGGGGFITQPFLMALGIPPQIAVANDVSAATASSVTAATNFSRKNLLRKDVIVALIPGLVVGAIAGCFALRASSPEIVEKLIAAFAVVFLIKTLVWREFKDPNEKDRTESISRYSLKSTLVGSILGFYTTFSGAGVGTLAAFLLAKAYGLSFMSSLGVRWACLPIAMIIGICTYFYLGLLRYDLLVALLIGNVAAGRIASQLAITLGERWLKPIFLFALAAFATYLLLK